VEIESLSLLLKACYVWATDRKKFIAFTEPNVSLLCSQKFSYWTIS